MVEGHDIYILRLILALVFAFLTGYRFATWRFRDKEESWQALKGFIDMCCAIILLIMAYHTPH